MPPGNSTIIDLSYIRRIGDNNEDFVRTMIQNFLEHAPKYLEEMNVAGAQNDWAAMAKSAHKLKPGASYVGANSLNAQLADLESYLKGSEIDVAEVELKLQEINGLCLEIYPLLSAELP